MGRGARSVSWIRASAVLLLALSAVPAPAHDDRPLPILRIDERLLNAGTLHLGARRQGRMLLRRAHFSRQSGMPAAALVDLDRALELGAHGRRMSYEHGLTLADLGRDDQALRELDRFLELGRPSAIALDARARVHEHLGHVEAAVADYTASLRLRDDAEIYLARGRLLQRLGRCDDAVEGYRLALARIGKAELLERALVSALSACGRYEEALAAIDAHVRSGRETTEWLLVRGDVLESAGDRMAARAARERALACADAALGRKRTAILYYERARAHAALGDVSSARDDLERILASTTRFEPALALAKTLDLASDDEPSRAAAGTLPGTDKPRDAAHKETEHESLDPN